MTIIFEQGLQRPNVLKWRFGRRLEPAQGCIIEACWAKSGWPLANSNEILILRAQNLERHYYLANRMQAEICHTCCVCPPRALVLEIANTSRPNLVLYAQQLVPAIRHPGVDAQHRSAMTAGTPRSFRNDLG